MNQNERIAAVQANFERAKKASAMKFPIDVKSIEPNWKQLFLSIQEEMKALREGIDAKHKEIIAALETDQGKAYAEIQMLREYIQDLKDENEHFLKTGEWLQ